MYHNCVSLCSLCEGREGANTIYISPFFMNYRDENQNAPDYLVGLIVQLVTVCGDCDFGTLKLNDFIGLSWVFLYWLSSLNIQLLKLLPGLYFVYGSINEKSIEHIRLSTFE